MSALSDSLARSLPGGLVQGVVLPWRGGAFLWRAHGLKRWALLPILANGLVYGGVMAGALWWLFHWDWQLGGPEWQFWGGFGGWLHRVLDRFMDVIKWAVGLPVLFIVCYFSFTSVGMIVASPFNDFLSERVERALGHAAPAGATELRTHLLQAGRSVVSSVRIVLRQLGAMALTVPFLLVPYFGFLPLFSVAAYFTGLGFLDVAMARHNLRHAEKKPLMRRCRWQLLGIGLAMELMFLVPFMALILLPMGVVAGTLLYHRAQELQRSPQRSAA